jgi:hypothetical protein
MNNHGLEALAALASSVAASATTSSTSSSNSNSISNSQVSGSNRTSAATGSPLDAAAANTQVTEFNRVMQNAATLLQQSSQNVTPHQWQQVLSAATGLVNTSPSFATTVNAAPSNTQASQLDQSAMLALQQQLSLYQRLFQNPSQNATSGNTSTVAQPNVMDAAAAMQFAMRTQSQAPFPPTAGKDQGYAQL